MRQIESSHVRLGLLEKMLGFNGQQSIFLCEHHRRICDWLLSRGF